MRVALPNDMRKRRRFEAKRSAKNSANNLVKNWRRISKSQFPQPKSLHPDQKSVLAPEHVCLRAEVQIGLRQS